MDNCDIRFYKDGNDVVVVFKNANKEISDIINRLMFGLAGNMAVQTMKYVPALDPLPSEKIAAPDIDKCEEIILDSLKDNCGSNPDDEPENDEVNQDGAEQEKAEKNKEQKKDEQTEKITEQIIGTENNQTDDKPVKEVDKQTVEAETVPKADFAENVFTCKKYKNMTPEQVVEKFGHIGFYNLCSAIYINTFRTQALRDETYKTVKEYFSKNNSNLGEIKGTSKDDLIKIISSCKYVCEDIINTAVQDAKCNNIEEYYEKTNAYVLRPVCWKCIAGIRAFVKGLN